MKKLYLFFLVAFTATFLTAQVSTNPQLPIDDQSVTIYFDATEGMAGLANFNGDIYAHTGVITDKSSGSSDWKYVIRDWGVNIAKAKLVRTSTNKYVLEIKPSIREFYGVPEGEKILKMAFVFRSADSSKEGKAEGGKDIFVDVYKEGLNVSLSIENNEHLFNKNESFKVAVSATQATDLKLLLNQTVIAEANGTQLEKAVTISDYGYNWLIAEATVEGATVRDSVKVFIKEPLTTAAKPGNLKKGINYTSDTSAALVLFAPYKEHVFVVGDFNNWELNNNYQMKKDGDYFWLSIENLIEGKEYIFQYLIDGKLKIADPYSNKVSDPWNDQYISDVTYPNLIVYPKGKTNGIATVIQTNQEKYNWQVDNFTPPAKEKMVIYEMLIRDFTQEHTFESVINKLNYLADLNVNVLELMPVNEFEGNSSWGYNPSFYFAVDKYYGTVDKLKALVDSCHARGIAVVMDMVLNHSFGQSPLAQMYMQNWTITNKNPWYNVSSPNQTYSWGYDFNHESLHTQAFVDSVNSYWMSEFKIDGFRFDFTKGFTNKPGDGWAYDASRIKLLKRMADEIWKRNDDAVIILEHLSENSEEKVLADYGFLLWGNINHSYVEGAMGYTTNKKSDISWSIYSKRGWRQPNLIAYPESHDEERLAFKAKTYGNANGSYNIQNLSTTLDRLELSALFHIPIPGPKMIWQFGELGYDYSIDYNDRTGEKPIKWEYVQEKDRTDLFHVIASLNYLKANYPEFAPTDFDYSLEQALKWLRLTNGDNHVIVIGNFDVVEKSIAVNFPKTGTWYNYFDKKSVEIDNSTQTIALQPGEYKLFSSRELTHPRIVTEISDLEQKRGFTIYPNPATNQITIKNDGSFKHLDIFSVAGRLLLSQPLTRDNISVSVENFTKGIYFVRLSNENSEAIEKIVVR